MVNATAARREGTEIPDKNDSAKSPANVTANQNDTTHPNKERASRTKPRIKLYNAEMTILPIMTISIQIISRDYFLNKQFAKK
jgi:hypothetical protein